jgi:hypothetical protein
MTTNCERCTREIEDDEVNHCPLCGMDGLCNDCLTDHECEGSASTPDALRAENRKPQQGKRSKGW